MLLKNNLTFLRLLAASLVLYGHAFVFLGLPEPLFLGYYPLGPLGVFVFFSISGYLVSKSWEADPNFWRFLVRRAVRIFPALVVCIVLSVLVLGAALTTLPLSDYFKHPATRGYFTNIWLYITFYLPGVFEHNRVPNAVNGSLWSLPAEFAMYLGVAFLGKQFQRWGALLITALLLALNLFWLPDAKDMLVIYRTDMRQFVICGIYFWIGALFQQFRVERWFTLTNVMLAIFIWICMTRWALLFKVSGWFLLPFIVLAFGLAIGSALGRATQFDYSYGIYIYAFPVQQTLVYFWPSMDVWVHIGCALVSTCILAAISWHFIEKKALKLKPIKTS